MAMTQNKNGYQEVLKLELERRKTANQQYSLRSFARDLRLTPQHLSLVIKGKKGLSQSTAAQIAERMEMDPQEALHFCDLVAAAHARGSSAKRLAHYRLETYKSTFQQRTLDMDVFKVIADVKHIALLELMETVDFRNDAKWIAKRIGISEWDVERILERLQRLEMIQEDKSGKLIKTHLRLTTTHDLPLAALKKFSREMLTKASESLSNQKVQERDISTITMAIDPNLIPEAKKRISKFRKELCAFLESGVRTEVYTFVPALFKLTNSNEENSNEK